MHNLLAAVFHRQPQKPASPSILQLFLPSCISILLFTTCFMAATWGWFTANQSFSTTTIKAGRWGATGASVVSTTVETTITEYYTLVSPDPSSAESTDPSGGTDPMALSSATDPASVETVSLEARNLAGDTEGSAEAETQNDASSASPAAEPSTEPLTKLLRTESETVTTYSDPEELPRNASNDFYFVAAANQNHRFTVETEGTASGYVRVTVEEIFGDHGEDDPTLWETENRTLYAFVDGDGTVEFNLLLSVPCMVTIHTSWGSPEEEALERDNVDIIPTESLFAGGSSAPLSSALNEDPDVEHEIPTYGCGVQEEILLYHEVMIETPDQTETPATPEPPAEDGRSPVDEDAPADEDAPVDEDAPAVSERNC